MILRSLIFHLRIPAAGLLLAALFFAGNSRAAEPAAEGLYRRQAVEVMNHIQKHFHDEKTGLYATAIDNKRPDYMWGCGVMFSALVGASRHDPDYVALMHRFFEALHGYWDTKVKVPGYEPAPTAGSGNDKYYDDNAWMVLTFLEAYELTNDVRYLKQAKETLEFVLSGWDEAAGGGIWWHEAHKDDGKNTCVNGPAAVGCFRMSKFDPKAAPDWIAKGRKIVEWTTKTLRAPNGLFSDHIKVSTGRIRRGQLTYNQGLMLRAYLTLNACTGEANYLDEAKKVAEAARALLNPTTGAWRDALKWSHLMVEADLELYRATGDESLLQRAKADGNHQFSEWIKKPPRDLITNASMAREMWLLADHESEIGRNFWKKSDRVKP